MCHWYCKKSSLWLSARRAPGAVCVFSPGMFAVSVSTAASFGLCLLGCFLGRMGAVVRLKKLVKGFGGKSSIQSCSLLSIGHNNNEPIIVLLQRCCCVMLSVVFVFFQGSGRRCMYIFVCNLDLMRCCSRPVYWRDFRHVRPEGLCGEMRKCGVFLSILFFKCSRISPRVEYLLRTNHFKIKL